MKDGIQVRGAREHNLKNITLDIPRNKITVFTGLSGSGKSSLAFNTVYAEGQRRYVDSLSAYARNFLEQIKKPDVDSISGLSPAIAIDQKTTSNSPRSTVGTITEVYDFLRLLFAKLGIPKCPNHGIPVTSQSSEVIADHIGRLAKGTKLMLLAPMVRGKKGEFQKEIQKWLGLGYVRARVDGDFVELQEVGRLAKTKVHNIDLVIDRLIINEKISTRISESVQTALELSNGFISIYEMDTGEITSFSQHASCPECGFSFPDIDAKLFSFNDPKGACESCHGLGYLDEEDLEVDEEGEVDDELDAYSHQICPECNGARLKPSALNVFIKEKNIHQLAQMNLDQLNEFVLKINFSARELMIVDKLVKNLKEKLDFLCRLGVGYLSLSRSARTLSGGEAQRIRLASQLGSPLVGILYVLDEPSIGLHPRDHGDLLKSLTQLRDQGNTIVIVEHDEDTILLADQVYDLGPGAGRLGGEVVASGTPQQIKNSKVGWTGKYLSGKAKAYLHKGRPLDKSTNWIEIEGASGNNLKNINAEIPVGRLSVITGVSGSGKSTLIIETLFREISNRLHDSGYFVQPFKALKGVEVFENVVDINQKPIGRTPRSNPATYVGLFSQIRDLFAQLPESRMRGYKPGRFSFNVKGGRCENCQGAGDIKKEMHFMADVFIECDVCLGKRYNRETLEVKYRDKSISDVLSMTVDDAVEFFKNHKMIHRKIETLQRVGLGYIRLGQSSTTLSGGEAQRIKLSRELSKKGLKHILYILDEPTTGLHFEDTRKLIELLHELVDNGHTVVVIEHNLDVIRSADYILDLGPDGGNGGGEIVAKGSPLSLKVFGNSATKKYLKNS
ncbi:MAG: excinuclease ABC subunit UvrA [Bdellovibrionales bacterium]|nr:excinuclease ABC subunit UvrA [Bdellovibrionales bacterium]